MSTLRYGCRQTPITSAVIKAFSTLIFLPVVWGGVVNVQPLNLQIREDRTITEDLEYVTENKGLGNQSYSSLRIYGNSDVDIQSENAYFTSHNTADENGKGNYTAFASKIDKGQGNTVQFTGGNVAFNAVSSFGAQGYVGYSSGATPYTLKFANSGDVNITAVVEGTGVGTTNAIGFMGNGQKLEVTDDVQNFNVNVYGSGKFDGNANTANGTAGLFFAGDTVSINAKNLNINVISGQDADVTLKTGSDSSLNAKIDFDENAAKEVGSSYGVTYGLNNKGNTTIGSGTKTTINVSDGYWNAVGISNDPMYLDENTTYSNYNLSTLNILGDLNVTVVGSSTGASAGDGFTGTDLDVKRLTATYGLYAGVTAIEGVDGYEDQTSVVNLGSEGKTVVFDVSTNESDIATDVYGIYGSKAEISIEGSQTLISVKNQTEGTAYGVKVENESSIKFASESTTIDTSGTDTVAISVDEGSTMEVTGTDTNQASLIANGLVQSAGQTNLTNATYTVTTSGSSLGSVTSNQSTVALLGTGSYSIETLSGEGGLSLDSKETTVSVGTISGNFNAGFANATADDFDDVAKEVGEIIDVGEYGDGSSLTTTIKEGDIKGSSTVVTDGENTTVTSEANTKLDSFRSVNVLGLMQWRHEMNDLTKRMGELRDSPEGVGTWVRAYGSSMEHGSQNVEAKNTSIQVGADFDVGYGWKVGAAFSYTNTDASMDNGSADGDMYGFAVYGSWLHESGQFVDLIVKYTRMDNEFDIGNMSGSFDNNGYSVSAEYGWHLRFNELAFVEPQIELTYGTVTGDDIIASNGVSIEQDDTDSFIGRIGLRGGFLFPNNKGTIYARASLLHDFDGETGFKASKDNNKDSFADDLGGTWYEFGVGANFNWTDSTYTYVDLERTASGEINEDWRWNVGVRHVF